MAAQRRRATQKDIATRLGISQSTVSLVVSGGPASDLIAEGTRRRVLEVATELGYAVNASARNLKGGVNRLLGVYTFEPVFPVDQRDFYFPFLLGVEEATAEHGYDLLLFSSASAGGDRRIYANGVNRLKVADGCVLLGRRLHQDDMAALLREDFPFVFIGRRDVPGHDLSYVGADYVGATRTVVRSLAELGHRRLAYLKVAHDQEWTKDRETGFRQGVEELGLPADGILLHPLEDSDVVAESLIEDWLAAGITAVLVEPSQDDTAISAVERAVTAVGARIPEDLSVVVLGDPPLVNATARDWTRFAIPREQMGRAAVQLLLELLADEAGAARQLMLDCIPIPGDSVAAPRTRPVARS
ncbi:LacI family DNA-binding transcriptional regulator [Microlunatus sp. GCM10028923]|uniref:LacI family DNA-binding transcriptional regulator n=1 Tax=Microlunatus sp. GCM10028923 TaxID=3273400 RepID=UPI0036062F8E